MTRATAWLAPLTGAAVLLSLHFPMRAQMATPVVHTLRFPAPQTHYVEVETIVPTEGRLDIELMMAVWTPGSYLVREFARHVEDLRAESPTGAPLDVVKTQKNRWRIGTGGAETVTVRYRLYARDLSVRTNFVDRGFALINGAPTFLAPVGQLGRPHEVRVDLPPTWTTTVSPLPPAGEGVAHRYFARDYDTLVDSPLLAGTPAIHTFEVDGVPHLLVNQGEAATWDGPRAARDVETIVRTHREFWGHLPWPRYVFFNIIAEAGGGLEHADSTVLMTSRWRMGTRREYLGWLALVSHELFHAWNGKRLRPVELGPFDYEREVYTTSLWIVEGFTDYYDYLLLRRSGLVTREEYLEQLSRTIRELQETPGRLTASASASSFDAWITHYRPDENSANRSISYYTKGAVVAFLLDARIRAITGGERSLDDVMRLAYDRYSGSRGYTQDEFRRTVNEVAGADLSRWLATAVDTTDELSYDEALAHFGLRFAPDDPAAAKAWLGATTRTDGGRLIVSQVRRGSPAFEAGLNVDDEIIALDGFRVGPDQLEARLEHYRPQQRVAVLVARRGELLPIEVILGTEPTRRWSLEARPDATPEQQARLRAWLGER